MKKKGYFSIHLCSAFQNNVLFHGTGKNYSDGCLVAQTSPICVRYHTSSNTRMHQTIRKIKLGVNGGSDKRFIQKKCMQELWINLYIKYEYELPYIDLLSKTKLVILPQSGQRKVIDYSDDHFHFLFGKYFTSKKINIIIC